MPILSAAELEVIERYVEEHRDEVMAEDRRIRERNANRRNPPHVEELLRRSREKRLALQGETSQPSPGEWQQCRAFWLM